MEDCRSKQGDQNAGLFSHSVYPHVIRKRDLGGLVTEKTRCDTGVGNGKGNFRSQIVKGITRAKVEFFSLQSLSTEYYFEQLCKFAGTMPHLSINAK